MRPIAHQDEVSILRLGERCSDESIHFRLFGGRRTPTTAERALITDTDGQDRFALVVEIDSEIVAVGRWITGKSGGPPEVAFLVEDRYQGIGIGTLLLERLASAAVLRGYHELQALVLGDNVRMLRVFDHSGLAIDKSLSDGVFDLTIHLSDHFTNHSSNKGAIS